MRSASISSTDDAYRCVRISIDKLKLEAISRVQDVVQRALALIAHPLRLCITFDSQSDGVDSMVLLL